ACLTIEKVIGVVFGLHRVVEFVCCQRKRQVGWWAICQQQTKSTNAGSTSSRSDTTLAGVIRSFVHCLSSSSRPESLETSSPCFKRRRFRGTLCGEGFAGDGRRRRR